MGGFRQPPSCLGLILTETKVYTKSSIRLDGFKMFPVVREENDGGGLIKAVKHGTCSSIIDEGENAGFTTVNMEFGNILYMFQTPCGLWIVGG